MFRKAQERDRGEIYPYWRVENWQNADKCGYLYCVIESQPFIEKYRHFISQLLVIICIILFF